MSIENKSNYFFPLSFHSVQCGVIISTYTKNILNQCLRYKFGNCWGNSYIPKIDIPLWSAFNFCEPPGLWPAISALGCGLPDLALPGRSPSPPVQPQPTPGDGGSVQDAVLSAGMFYPLARTAWAHLRAVNCNLRFQSTQGIITKTDLCRLNTSTDVATYSPPTRQSSVSFRFVQFLC